MRLLCTVWGFPGCVHPFFAVAKALKERGHEVGVYTGAFYREAVLREGWRFFPVQPAIERIVEERVFSSNSIGANWHRPWKVPALLKEFFVDSIPLQLADLEGIFQAWPPDAILCDPALFAPFLVFHETRGVPVALLSYVLGCMIPGPEIPPVGLGLPRPKTAFGRLANALVGRLVDLRLRSFRAAVNRHRVSRGLFPVAGSVTRFAVKLPLYLVTSCPELDYPRRTPGNVHYVGGCFWYPPLPPPDWLRDLPSSPPTVYVNEGTIHVAAPYVLRSAVRGLAALPIRVILTTGTHRDPAQLGLGALPGNFLLAPWVNHDALMPKIRAMVCTGGPGTVLAALRHGVPMVVIPTEWDHPENAARLAEAGIAIRLSPRRCTPERLRTAVETVLGDPSYARNARRIGGALARQGGAQKAAGLLEEMVGGLPRES